MAVPPNTTAASPIEVGKAALAFTLKDQQGQPHHLADQRGRWVLLYFYPRDNTPGCTKQACQFRDTADAFADRNVTLLGVSPDDVASHAKFADKFALPFPLLADPEAGVCKKYGVWQEKKMYGKKFLGVVRTTYLIDPRGKVAHRWDKVKVTGHAEAALAKLNELGG